MNRLSFEELTASELNDAIDDTNFPKARISSAASYDDNDESSTHQNGKTKHSANPLNGNDDNTNDPATDAQDLNESHPTNLANGIKGFIKRAHPAPLKMVAFKSDSIDVATPRTPRTSTTPGKLEMVF